MKLKMKGATAQGDTDLCATCRNSQRMRSAETNVEVTICRKGWETMFTVPGRIAECSGYDDSRQTPLHSMEKIAWPISTDRKTGQAGFLTPKQYAKAKADGKLDEGKVVLLPNGDTYEID